MDLKMDQNSNKTSDAESSVKSPPICTVKHFKKSMIVEYEKIEPTATTTTTTPTLTSTTSTLQTTIPTTEDSQSSVSSHSSTSSSSSNSSSSSSGSSSSSFSNKSVTSFSDPTVSKKLKNDQAENASIGSMVNTVQKNSPDRVKNFMKPKSSSSEFNFKGAFDKKKNSEAKSTSEKERSKSSKSSKSKSSKKTYCICRTSDTQRFMIACDKCDEWFHGDCVGVSQSLSKKIKAFFCHLCRRKKPSLTIRYKSKFEEFLRSKSSHSNSPDLHSSFLKFQKENRTREKKEHELNSKSTSSNKIHSALKSSQSSVTSDDLLSFVSAISQLRSDTTTASTSHQSDSIVRKRKHSENFASGSNDRSKTNGENEDSDHDARYKKYARESSDVSSSDQTTTEDSSDQYDTDGHEATDKEITDETENDSFVEADSEDDSDYKDFARDGFRKQSQSHSKNNPSSKKPNEKTLSNSNKNTVNVAKKSKASSSGKSAKVKSTQNRRIQGCKTNQRKPNPSLKTDTENDKVASFDKEENDEIIRVGPVQCLGPTCTREALKKSKYCSEECGLSLAKNRLVSFLKSRIEQYNESPSYAKILNESELDRINNEISSLRLKLKELEKRHVELDGMIDQARTQAICGLVEKEREQGLADSNETEIYCVTCGSLHTEKLALKHMEKCFNKIESQASFGSYFKTHIEGTSMFCDYYNAQTKMYCKRLKVMCPEHEKEKKVNEDEVCGCPLPNASNILDDSKRDICLASKRNCSIHYKWEKLRRAHIDLEKLRIWLKLEELLEQKRINETSLSQRASLLSILLHQTKYTSEPDIKSKNDTVV